VVSIFLQNIPLQFFFGKISRIFTEKNKKLVVEWQDFTPPKKNKKSLVLAGPQNIAGFFNYSTFPSISSLNYSQIGQIPHVNDHQGG